MKGFFLTFGVHGADRVKQKCPIWKINIKNLKDKGVHILAINLKDTKLKAETFRDQYGLTFPIARDPDESVRRAYNVMPLPTTIPY